MSPDDPTDTTRPARGSVCVVLAAGRPGPAAGEEAESERAGSSAAEERLSRCLESVRRHSPAATPVISVEGSAEAVNEALDRFAPADVVVLLEPCEVGQGWLGRLGGAARADTNTATACALVTAGTQLSLSDRDEPPRSLEQAERSLARETLRLRPRLDEVVGPCVYVRREALELAGPLETELDLRTALEVDFAGRCRSWGLSHVAADDVVVEPLAGAPSGPVAGPSPEQREPSEPESETGTVARALEAARRPRSRLSVTLDGRALGSTLTGTQRHILELAVALAGTDALRMRVLVGPDTSAAVVEQLRCLPHTEVLATEEIDAATARSSVFHRPQQVFGVGDMRFALRLGERLVVNQLDLIAYRNPAYHPDATSWLRYRRVGRQALASADRVVVSSEHTRRELLTDELVDEGRVRLIPPGLDHRSRVYQSAADADPGAAPAAVPEDVPFMLCLGTDFRHKNRVFALRLLDRLREHHGWEGHLVLAGTHVPYGSSRELEDELLARSPELRQAVLELGSIDEQEKAWLMQRAAAVVYPSVYEGFGLVPLEAALSGVPCVFAPQSSLAEVLPAEAAAIVPWDPGASAARAYELLENPLTRTRQVQALTAVAEGFRWEQAAEATVEVYREALVAPVREAAALSRDEVAREHELLELIAAHDELVRRLVGEREHARGMYDELNAEVGSGLALIGPHGSIPEDLQRALLALGHRPRLSRPVYGALAGTFRAGRNVRRRLGPPS
jgi:glycosyltransferase involved in cell wall biosynthesis